MLAIILLTLICTFLDSMRLLAQFIKKVLHRQTYLYCEAASHEAMLSFTEYIYLTALINNHLT